MTWLHHFILLSWIYITEKKSCKFVQLTIHRYQNTMGSSPKERGKNKGDEWQQKSKCRRRQN